MTNLNKENVEDLVKKAIPIEDLVEKSEKKIISEDISYIKNLYCRFEGELRKKFDRNLRIKFFDKNGKIIDFLIEKSNFPNNQQLEFHSVPVDNRMLYSIICMIGKQKLPHFTSLKIFLRENGNLNKIHEKKMFLELLVATPDKKNFNARTKYQLVTACKNCDGLLYAVFITGLHSHMFEGDLHRCPYCNKEMDYYWRRGKIHERDFIFDAKCWNNFKNKMKWKWTSMMPTSIKGRVCPVYIKAEDILKFLMWYSNLMPNKVLGPFCVVFQDYGKKISRIFAYQQNPMVFGEATLFPKDMIRPKMMFYDENLSMEQRYKIAKQNLEKIEKKTVKSAKKKMKETKKTVIIKNEKENQVEKESISLNTILEDNSIFNNQKILTNVYLKMSRTKRGVNNAQFYANLCLSNGKSIEIQTRFEKQNRDLNVSEVQFNIHGLRDLMKLIQSNQPQLFSEVKFFVLESSIEYSGSDIHYYLKPILGRPGNKTKVSLGGRKVKACAECNTMLLRYSFNWEIQEDDLKKKKCPYCQKPLRIIERSRRIVSVLLDFKAENLKITGTNNQIGAIYKSTPVKLTTKVKSTFQFLQNYENLFDNNVMGPFKIDLVYQNNKPKIQSIEFGGILKKIEWRPAVLYPEDLITI